MSEQLFDRNDYNSILKQRFGRSDLKFVSSTIKPLSENVEGYMGEHYKMTIFYRDGNAEKEVHFFIKTIPMKNKIQTEVAKQLGLYDTEIFLYDFLFREFEKYGLETSFAPKCFHCVPGKTMVMEDLTRSGFELKQRKQWYNLEECQCGLRSIAKFHAGGYAYELIKSKETGKPFLLNEEYSRYFSEKIYTQFMDVNARQGEEWINSSMDLCKTLVDYLPKTEEYKNEFKKLLEDLKLGDVFVKKTQIKKILGHGDLWSNNMLFKRENNITTHCVLVDYQVLRYFYPAYDVLMFLYTNTTASFRKKHFEELKNFYYEFLQQTLKSYGYHVTDFYPVNDFENSIQMVEFCAMFQAFATHMFAFLPMELLNKKVNEGNNGLEEILFRDRVTSSLEAFNNDETYKQIALEDMDELFKILKKK